MRLKLFFTIFLWGFILLNNITSVDARWYWDVDVPIDKNSGEQFCPHDWTIDNPHPENGKVPLKWGRPWDGEYYRPQQSRVTKYNAFTNKMTCQKWDPIKPKAGTINYHNDWTKERDIKISIRAFDEGGSTRHIKSYSRSGWFSRKRRANWENDVTIIVQEKSSTNGPEFSDWSDWYEVSQISDSAVNVRSGSLGNNLSANITLNKDSTCGTAYRFRYKVIDWAGNESNWQEGRQIYKLDTCEPELNNFTVRVTPNPGDEWDDATGDNSNSSFWQFDEKTNNFMAGDESPIEIIYKNKDGAPIKIHYSIEQDNNPLGQDSQWSKNFRYRFRIPHIFKNVENDLDYNTGGRKITLKINKIVDAAGNEKIITKTFPFYVFANIREKIKIVESSDGNGIADGSEHTYSQELKDTYGNKIIPASKIGRTLKRTTQTSKNNMYLNQQTRTGPTSVFVNGAALPFDSTKLENPDQNQNPEPGTSKYTFKVRVYTPTANVYSQPDLISYPVSDPDATFSLKSWLTISDDQSKIRSVVPSKRVESYNLDDPKFEPLFTNKITWDLRDGWFIEGAIQNSKAATITNSWSSVSINPNVLLNYSGSQSNQFDLYSPQTRLLDPGINKPFWEGYPDLLTFLKQDASAVGDTSNIQLSTHFKYTLDWKNIIYNGDIIGKAHYHDPNKQDLGNQVGIKILGNSNNKNLHLILNDQINDIGNSIWESVVQNTRNSINQSVLLATRNIPMREAGKELTSLTDTSSGSDIKAWVVQQWDNASIMLLEWSGNIKFSTLSDNVFKISGKRTLVLRGMNLYIDKDMAYTGENPILGVAIYKDKDGKGWNLYIDPKVTNVVGHYITDGAVISYDWKKEIITWEANTLKNQLHIYGSLISYNTIGGSRDKPIRCPVFISSCDTKTSQKYDLNFLRRYYLYKEKPSDNGKPFGNGKVIGGGTIDENGNVKNWAKSGLRTLFDKSTHELAKYPVVIEYNPLILTNPPIGFEAYRQ